MTENFMDAADSAERNNLANISSSIVQDHEEQRAAHRANFERINSSINGLNSFDIVGLKEIRDTKLQDDLAKAVDDKFQLSPADKEQLNNIFQVGRKDSEEDLRIERECKDYDDSIRANPMENAGDQKLRQRIGHAILSGNPEELEAIIREHRPTSMDPGRIGGVLQRVKEDLQKKGISVDYSVGMAMDDADAEAALKLPISQLRNGQHAFKYTSRLDISKGAQSVRVISDKDAVVSSSAFVSSGTEVPPPKDNETPDEAAERFKIFLSQPPKQRVDTASALRRMSK